MFDKFCFKAALVAYKKRFVQTQWPDEKYKWEAVQCFQANWDVDAEDFAAMLTKALSQTSNLLASVNNFPARMITKFAEIAQEEVRSMFIGLFDESNDIYERIDTFKQKSNILLERYGNGTSRHYQHENAISTYLWLRYPDKYYIYKLSEVKAVSNKLESDHIFKKGAYADNIRNYLLLYNEICEELKQDEKLKNMLTSQITRTCYPDPELKTLTIDFCFFISRYLNEDDIAAPTDEWWPKDYTPALSVDDWEALLNDKDVFTDSSLEIMKRMLDHGEKATCTQLSIKYGESVNFYNSGSSRLAKRIVQKTGCPVMPPDEKKNKYWPVLYVGKDAKKDEAGMYVWKLRDELSKALQRVDLSNVKLYAKIAPRFWKISHSNDGITDAEATVFEKRRVVVVHQDISAKEKSSVRQGRDFTANMKKGDFFYMCRGNSIKLLGRINTDKVEENPEKQDGWCERSYTVIAESCDINVYTGKKKQWSPNFDSICSPIPESDMALFEDSILKPYFNVTTEGLLNDDAPIHSSKEKDAYTKEDFLKEVYMPEAKYDRLAAVLQKKKNIILQGAPGVGKTFAAKRLAYSIMGAKDDDRIAFVQFHQNYSYEDFMMGYKPVEDGFELKYGIFYNFCQKAANRPDKDHFFIIDEINRGNISKIFGELLMLIEADYRDKEVTLAYNGLGFSVPKRLHMIGMMNTADRSLDMIDYALRRRFSFFDMEPGFDSEGFINYQKGFADDTFNTLIERIKDLNREITQDKSLGKGFCIGHSYFCNADECTEEWMKDVVDFDILPMLSEYWFDEDAKLQRWENVLHGVFQ